MKGGNDNDIWRENQASQNSKEADPEAACRKKLMQSIIQLVTGKKISVSQIWTLLNFYAVFWK
nr:MAG TPA: hypothetical protein [Caudoviricetes sp.]